MRSVAVYEWQAWDSFLVSHLVDAAGRVTASYDDPPDVLARALDAGADAVLPQINLSHGARFPHRRAAILDYCRGRGAVVLNASIGDIRKRTLHALLAGAGLPTAAAAPEGDGDEWLFVKSNLNSGGRPETRWLGGEPALGPREYYRTQRKAIRPEVWADERLVVERYVDNPVGSFYRVYRFGDAVVVVKGHSRSLIKKLSGHPDDVNHPYWLHDVVAGNTHLPDGLGATLSRFFATIPLEYGCLDIVHDLTDYYVVDLNPTPYSGVDEENAAMVAFLQEGAGRHLEARRASRPAGAA